MLWTLLALLSLIVLGGFIAYYGDLQGRRWGKRRVSWLGLRPKHTAILITSLTGAFISLLSIATLLLINRPVREVVLRGEAAIRENKRLNALLLEQQLASSNSLREARNQTQLAQSKLADANEAVSEKEARAHRLNQKLSRLREREKKLLTEYAAQQRQLFKEQRLVAALNPEIHRLEQIKQKLTVWNQNSAAINRETGRQNVELARENIALSKNNTAMKTANEKLTEGNKNLINARDQLFKANTTLEDVNKQLLAGNQQQENREQELRERITQLNGEFEYLSGLRTSITHSYLALRQGKFSLRAGAELGRRTLDPHLRPEAVRAKLIDLLDEVSAAAITHGAVLGDNGRAVCIVSKRIVTLAGRQDADEAASLNALIDRVAASDTPVVIVANAVNNSVEGEQVLIELTPFAVRRIFAKDEEVAQCVLNAGQPTDRIFDSIVQFLNKEVRDAALKAGTIPQTDPETGQQRVGSIETSDLLKLTEQIRRKGGQVVLTAVAKDSLTSADTLRLEFKLSRPSDKS